MNDRSLCRLSMEHRWALSKAEDDVLWRNENDLPDTERQASHTIPRMTLPKVTTRCLCDSRPEAGRSLCGTWPAACCTLSMTGLSRASLLETSSSGGTPPAKLPLMLTLDSGTLGKGGVKDAGPGAGMLDRPGVRCAGKACPAQQHRISLRKPLDAGELPVSPVC